MSIFSSISKRRVERPIQVIRFNYAAYLFFLNERIFESNSNDRLISGREFDDNVKISFLVQLLTKYRYEKSNR